METGWNADIELPEGTVTHARIHNYFIAGLNCINTWKQGSIGLGWRVGGFHPQVKIPVQKKLKGGWPPVNMSCTLPLAVFEQLDGIITTNGWPASRRVFQAERCRNTQALFQ